jgi:hypothetical protein
MRTYVEGKIVRGQQVAVEPPPRPHHRGVMVDHERPKKANPLPHYPPFPNFFIGLGANLAVDPGYRRAVAAM